MSLYVYGLMRAQDGDAAVADAPPDGPALQTVAHGEVCALVSPVSEQDLKLRRRSLLAHSETLQAAFAHGPVLPLRFGTIVADSTALEHDVLGSQEELLSARLDALEELGEMQVKATYHEEPLLRSILSASPQLAARAAMLRRLPAAATHFDRLALGEAIGAAVQKRRELDAQRLIEALRYLATAVRVSEPSHERAVLTAAFLVRRDALDEFEAAVEALVSERGDEMQFRLIGPMPAHSFADFDWEERPDLHRSDPVRTGGA